MIIIKDPRYLREFLAAQKALNRPVGFVPTMGALHQGHIDLVNVSGSRTDLTVCSIFVNPTQFNDPGDYHKYPNRLEQDIRLLSSSKADILFLPPVEAMYPQGTSSLEQYDLGYLETILEGKYRPGHFQGVCQVMFRLLNMVQPHQLFMGQKDYQQCMVVKKLIDDYLSFPVELIPADTIREKDGLAMSSRNLRLPPADREKAALLHQMLLYIGKRLHKEAPELLEQEVREKLEKQGFRVDYVQIADASDLKPVSGLDSHKKVVALVAAFLGEVRLIDNMVFN